MGKHIEILDTTLRDGAQSAEITFSLKDKLSILALLDDLGIDFAECGNPASSPTDRMLFENLHDTGLRYTTLKPVAFTSTCREGFLPEDDDRLNLTLSLAFDYVGIVGKASAHHVRNVLKISDEENLRLITSTVGYAVSKGKKVIFYAEHFFDGCRVDEEYSLNVCRKAFEAGANTVVLCDTNGGTMTQRVFDLTGKVASLGIRTAIHTHNDCGLAAANTLESVRAGAVQAHGTFCGIGERCGNADLSVVIPDLQLKLGYDCVPKEKMFLLSSTARAVADFANITFNERTPYVGRFAFSHKAGMHIDGFLKDSGAFEHIDPSSVGNNRKLLLSELAGRAAIADKLSVICSDVTKDSEIVGTILERIKNAQAEGYLYDNSDASLMLLMLDSLGRRKSFFTLDDFKIVLSDPTKSNTLTAALIKITVGETTALEAAEGLGPVNAMDAALRKALERFYPRLKEVRLVDYRVRVIDSADATAAKVRVVIDSADTRSSWRTIGVSRDIIEASWEALCESFDYKLSMLEGLI